MSLNEWSLPVKELSRECGYAGPDDAATSYNCWDDDELESLLEKELDEINNSND